MDPQRDPKTAGEDSGAAHEHAQGEHGHADACVREDVRTVADQERQIKAGPAGGKGLKASALETSDLGMQM